jgi:hypothetical protein
MLCVQPRSVRQMYKGADSQLAAASADRCGLSEDRHQEADGQVRMAPIRPSWLAASATTFPYRVTASGLAISPANSLTMCQRIGWIAGSATRCYWQSDAAAARPSDLSCLSPVTGLGLVRRAPLIRLERSPARPQAQPQSFGNITPGRGHLLSSDR